MGTRGAFGVIINEQEKIGYNQFDSYPDGRGVENLRWLRGAIKNMDLLRKLAEDCLLVDEDKKPTKAEIKHLAASTNLGVSEQSTDDWYCLTRGTHGSIGEMLSCGYILDSHTFPFDSLFCEWAYIVDLDRNLFEVYEGFQKTLPEKGRWAGRPTPEDDRKNYLEHLEWCADNKRDPWLPEVAEYKAVELVASWPLDALPSDEDFLTFFALREAREAISRYDEYPEDVARLWKELQEEDDGRLTGAHAVEWIEIKNAAFLKLKPSDVVKLAMES